jgi:decaprenyl-phosphate phosphoribosyltransferase
VTTGELPRQPMNPLPETTPASAGPAPASPEVPPSAASLPIPPATAAASPGLGAGATARALVRGMRPPQWIKNVLVFMAPAAAGVLGDARTTARVVGAFVVFCFVASGTYLVNDVIDAASDRHHPVKRRRPVASGEVRPSTALGAGAILIAFGLAGAIVLGPWGLAVVVGSYALLNIAYSLRLKQEPVVELAVVASAFVLRAVAGGVVADVRLSNWFLVFTSFAALFVVTGKRSAEHSRLGHDRGAHRAVLDEYSESFLKSTLTISAAVSVATYCLWAFDRTGLLAHAGHKTVWIELTVIPLVLAVLHILRLLDAGKGGEPEQLALRDHLLQGYALSWAVLMGIGLYA